MRASAVAVVAAAALAGGQGAQAASVASGRAASSSAASLRGTAVAPPFAATRRRLQIDGGAWTTDHHDIRNSGYTDAAGPGESDGTCFSQMLASDPADPTTARFYGSGISSIGLGWWFGGDSQNTFWMFEDAFGQEEWYSFSLNLTDYFGTTPVTPRGVIGSGDATLYPPTDSNVAYLASGDGNVYAMSQIDCWNFAKAQVNTPYSADVLDKRVSVPAPEAIAAAPLLNGDESLRLKLFHTKRTSHLAANNGGSAKKARAAQADPECGLWHAGLGRPFLTSTRLVQWTGASYLFVVDTDPSLDSFGTLHCIDAWSGQVYYNFALVDPATQYWYGSKGIVPAVWGPTSSVVWMPYGRTVAALKTNTGALLYNFTLPNFDRFVSSPAVSSDGLSMYIHGATGALYAFNILGSEAAPSLTLKWSCTYDPLSPFACNPVPAVVTRVLEVPAADGTLGGVDTPKRYVRETLDMATLVPGGWYQPTFVHERDELYALIAAAHTEVFGSAATEAVRTAVYAQPPVARGMVLTSTEALETAVASQLAQALPKDRLYSLVTSTGYNRLRPNGKPGAFTDSDADFGGTFPYATPSLHVNDTIVYLSNFNLTQDSAIFALDADFGYPKWGFNAFKTLTGASVDFGASRSSPAVDSKGFVYVAADVDPVGIPGRGDSVPALFALNADSGSMQWVVPLDAADFQGVHFFKLGLTVGSASPVVVPTDTGGERVFSVAIDSVVSITPGRSCPTSNLLQFCSGHGSCDCQLGQCQCLGCWSGSPTSPDPMCNTFNASACVNGGSCASDGSCLCPDGWQGPTCADVVPSPSPSPSVTSTASASPSASNTPTPSGTPSPGAPTSATATPSPTGTSPVVFSASHTPTPTSAGFTRHPVASQSPTPSAAAVSGAGGGGGNAAGVAVGVTFGLAGAGVLGLFAFSWFTGTPVGRLLPSPIAKALKLSPRSGYANFAAPGSGGSGSASSSLGSVSSSSSPSASGALGKGGKGWNVSKLGGAGSEAAQSLANKLGSLKSGATLAAPETSSLLGASRSAAANVPGAKKGYTSL